MITRKYTPQDSDITVDLSSGLFDTEDSQELATGMVIKFATSDGKIEVYDAAEHYRRILLARDRRDWDDYVKALQGWSRAACKAAYERSIL